MKKLLIHSLRSDYAVYFDTNIQQTLTNLCRKRAIHLLIDRNIWKLYNKHFFDKRAYRTVRVFEGIEDKKNMQEVTEYIDFLLAKKIKKDHKLVVIGGGIVQDIGSFTAHILLRGIDWIYFPTTLLAMSDSCIGSKSGVNVGNYKNQVGVFHPPTEIYLYLPFLNTLPQSEILNGYGEIIKHSLIKGGRLFKFISKNIIQIPKNKKITEEIIYQSLLIKKEIIEKDEFDVKDRKVLNYGHTFGHALEGYTQHKISHGIGVLMGMDIANYISLKMNLLPSITFSQIHDVIYPFITEVRVKISDFNAYMDFLSKDKKIIGDNIFIILARDIGKIEITKTKPDTKLKNNIKEYFTLYSK